MRPEFEVHLLNVRGQQKAKAIAEAFDRLLGEIEQIVPPSGRNIAIVKTKLEEACFFAKKAMAIHLDNQIAF